jgi:hypothetical protein
MFALLPLFYDPYNLLNYSGNSSRGFEEPVGFNWENNHGEEVPAGIA